MLILRCIILFIGLSVYHIVLIYGTIYLSSKIKNNEQKEDQKMEEKDLFVKLVEKNNDLTEREKGAMLVLWEVLKSFNKVEEN